ncbi:MAG: shikimate kinase [Sphingomonadales bacterium 32-68-7]|nr:MAG: shikimate kinase [Sphingomonadales bacterium 12-68-11]OYX07508.1 MAG: shikimate kinase [Sphingomonadales bacterium 32-68-7]
MTIEPRHPTDAEVREIKRRIDRPVVLVGMMGVGKSTIGRKLAAQLELPFHDADEEIEAAAQMTVAEVFERFGEAHFRDGERRVIARLIEAGPSVLATGGGAFVQDDTRALILERGIAIWLDSDIDTLVSRVGRRDTRPLLQGGDPREILVRLKAERESAYAQAPIRVTSDSGPHGDTLARILGALAQWP